MCARCLKIEGGVVTTRASLGSWSGRYTRKRGGSPATSPSRTRGTPCGVTSATERGRKSRAWGVLPAQSVKCPPQRNVPRSVMLRSPRGRRCCTARRIRWSPPTTRTDRSAQWVRLARGCGPTGPTEPTGREWVQLVQLVQSDHSPQGWSHCVGPTGWPCPAASSRCGEGSPTPHWWLAAGVVRASGC